MTSTPESVPFRWDLITPDQLGSLFDDAATPDLWFLDDLVVCTGKVLARSRNGDLFFVGRSLDSMFDLLGGVLTGTAGVQRLHRLPLSFQRQGIVSGRRWRRRPLTAAEIAQGRRFLETVGLTPYALARRDRPAVLVDVVHEGETFTELFALMRDWIEDEREPWPVIRRLRDRAGTSARGRHSPRLRHWSPTVAARPVDKPSLAPSAVIPHSASRGCAPWSRT
ncbi:hypothetical protein [Actinoplanes sp. CA-252034]|uniref:hypothetical protein n=1 Tax=Actinoplanes sp. CA-252034 TaxID=3239906 RepID=UPI003D976173